MKFFDLEISSSLAARGGRAAYYQKPVDGKCKYELFIHPKPDVPCSTNGTFITKEDSNCKAMYEWEDR